MYNEFARFLNEIYGRSIIYFMCRKVKKEDCKNRLLQSQ